MICGAEALLGRFGGDDIEKVFVTGATGLLGSWLVKSLVDSGCDVICLIRDTVPKSQLYLSGYHNKVRAVVRGSLEDYFCVERTLNEYEVDTVFHLGAQTIVGAANRSPISTFESNIKGTWNVLEAARNSKLVERVVLASSDKAYGEQKVLPYTEDMPLIGRHPYDVSKSCADLLAQSYHYTYGLAVGIARCGNFYGGGDLNFNRIIPGTIKSVLMGEPPIIRSNGKYVRDYIYVEDAVDAFLLLAKYLDNPKLRGQAFNFSSERPMTVLELVSKILEIMDREDLEPVILNEAVNEIERQYLSAEKARKVLKWRCRHTLEEGLSKTISWYGEFFKK